MEKVSASTIYALASAYGKAGVSVFRLSGPDAVTALNLLCEKPLSTPRKVYYRPLLHPQTKEIIDQALVFYFKSPHSFTGEDVAEIHTHGSIAVIRAILDALKIIPGLRLAEPGEFARRAFFNQKLDLTQAEALADLIEAESSMQLKQALRQLGGSLHDQYETWRKELIEACAFIEAYIDFSDEDIPTNLAAQLTEKVERLRNSLKSHLQDNRRGEKLRHGIYVTLVGPPNAGKSSLLNYLAAREAAIVSPIAGTTRDIVEIHLDLGGYPFIIADTAGLHETAEQIESEGINRALARASSADLNLILCAEAPLAKNYLDPLINNSYLLLINKCDSGGQPEWAERWLGSSAIDKSKVLTISVHNKIGLEHLEEFLIKWAEDNFTSSDVPVITRERHREHLTECYNALSYFNLTNYIELAAEDLRLASFHLGMITGFINPESVLDRVFSNFCIGK